MLTFGASLRAALAEAAIVTGDVPVADKAGRVKVRVCAVASWLDHDRKSPVGKLAKADDEEPTPSLADVFLFGLDMLTILVCQLVHIQLLMCVTIRTQQKDNVNYCHHA